VQKLDLLLTRTGVPSNNVPTTSKNTDRGSYTDANLKTISSIANVAPTTTSDTPSMDLGQRFASLMLGDSAAQIAARQMQNQLGQQLQRMVKEGRWQANLSLNPARLGHVNINLLMEDGVLQTQILSANAGVRELLEASLPRLKDQLEQSGMQLSSVSVGSHNTGQNKRHSDQPDWNLTQVGSEANDNASVAGTTNRAKHDGDIDTFA
jgi:flagellar hook-length control protein FliK